MPIMIDHHTYPHIVQAIMFSSRSVMLLFRTTSHEMRDAVDRVIFHTAVLSPSSNPASFFLCERNGRLRLPWIPMHAVWPSVKWPGVQHLSYLPPLFHSLSHSQLAFIRVLTIAPGPYLSRRAFVFPSLKHFFHTLDSFGQLAELRWPSPPATWPATYYIGVGANLLDIRPDLPIATSYTFHLPIVPSVLDSIVVPPGVSHITINLYYNRIFFPHTPRSRDELHSDLNLGRLQLDGNIGEVVIILDFGDRTVPGSNAKGVVSQGPTLLGLFEALGVALKRCLHANVVRPRQLSFILVGLEHLLPSEVGLSRKAGHARVTAAAVTRVLYPRRAEMGTPPSNSPSAGSVSSWGSPSPMPAVKPGADSLALSVALGHSNAPLSPPLLNGYARSPPSTPAASHASDWRSQDLVGHVRVHTHATMHRLRLEGSRSRL